MLGLAPPLMAGLLAIVLTNAITAVFTRNYTQRKITAEHVKVLEVELKKQKVLQAKMGELEQKANEVRIHEVERVRYITKKVKHVVQAPAYSNPACNVTDDGVRIYNAAASGVRLDDTSPPAPVVPAKPADTSAKRDDGRPAGGDRSRLRSISRVPAK